MKIIEMANISPWIRQQQEREGNYWFSGTFYVTRGVQCNVTFLEIALIYHEVKKLVFQENGLDYLQVYIHDNSSVKN